ncbi:Carbohydrate sulfotransferase 1 [Stylophora pistillata]|uniref:Carbohydrate sulfotransferase 1 n=1 Tax=Stylophora pistillata TaxID=50429 RepID=A0A2B4S793_STYPI|nr:Carbohydrate sulfotransferase 1 [Stylophora pistillata]
MNRKLAGNGEEETKQSVVDTSPRRTVIILAQPRSGSSLLGGAFNQNPDLFYIFEPLHGLMSFLRQEIDNAESMNFLRGILRCHSKDNGPRQSLMLYSTKICRQIEANLRTFQNFTGQMKEKYFLLRYEDLTKNLTGTLKRVFDLTEVRMHKNTLGWVKSHTSENNKNNGDALSTNRNSKAQIDKWRLEVDPELVNIIEDSCRSVMLLLGYKPLNRSETAQYNLILSLYDDQGEH